MWQIWLIGILGLWIVLVVLLGFSSTLAAFFLIVSGLAIAFFSFRLAPFIKIPPKQNDSEILPASPSASLGGPPEEIPPASSESEESELDEVA